MPTSYARNRRPRPTIVVKVGTRVLTRSDGLLDQQRIAPLAEDAPWADAGRAEDGAGQFRSGGGGHGPARARRRPVDLAHLQAVAAIGQSPWSRPTSGRFAKHGHHAAQVLLTADDLGHRTRYLNARNTLLTLLEFGASDHQ